MRFVHLLGKYPLRRVFYRRLAGNGRTCGFFWKNKALKVRYLKKTKVTFTRRLRLAISAVRVFENRFLSNYFRIFVKTLHLYQTNDNRWFGDCQCISVFLKCLFD